jgi:hypothetical protein
MNKHEQYIVGLLEQRDYLIGKDLNQELRSCFADITPGNERKILQRAVKAKLIMSSDPVTFGNGQYVYFHPSKKLNKDMILQIAKVHRQAMYRVMCMIDYNDGVLSKYEAIKFGACPLDPSKTKNDSVDKIIEDLTNLKFAEQIVDSKGVHFIVRTNLLGDADERMERHSQSMAVDALFVLDILKSLQRLNIISGLNVLYRRKTTPSIGVSHNNFLWDAIGYTKTTGINPVRASEADTVDKQTLVVLDIVVSRPYTAFDLKGFMSRIQATLNSVKEGKRKILPVIVYTGTETKKLANSMRMLGILSFDIGTIYGSKVYDIISNIIRLKRNDDGEYHSSTEELVKETLATMRNSGQEENLGTIKGDLFEYLLFPLMKLIINDGEVIHGKKFPYKDESTGKEGKYEYDYITRSHRYNEVIVFELKGYSSNYISLGEKDQKETLRWFFGKTFPVAYKALKTENPNANIRTCYITTSKFKDDGLEFLNKTNTTRLKPSMLDCWYDGDKLIKLLEQHRLINEKELIKRYYIKNDDDTEEDEPIEDIRTVHYYGPGDNDVPF